MTVVHTYFYIVVYTQRGCHTLKLNNSIWDKEELPEKVKESIIVPLYKKDEKTDFSNYRGISLLPTT
jgi:hypothetical protein